MQQANFNETVAGEIRAELGRRKISQQELAGRVGWAGSQLSRRLSGIVPFSTDDIDRIADALGVSRDQLMSPRLPTGWHIAGEQPEAEDGDGGRSYASAVAHQRSRETVVRQTGKPFVASLRDALDLHAS